MDGRYEYCGYRGRSPKEAKARFLLQEKVENAIRSVGAPVTVAHPAACRTACEIQPERIYGYLSLVGMKWDQRAQTWGMMQ